MSFPTRFILLFPLSLVIHALQWLFSLAWNLKQVRSKWIPAIFDKKRKDKYKRLTIVRQRYQLFPSRDTDDQRILESDSSKTTPGHIQAEVVVLNATFP